jgi:predicted nucleic-acid-binding Zn-ribbon protein
MSKCPKCRGKVFVDRQYSSSSHLETFCINCGYRKFFHPPTDSAEGTWLLKKEALKAKATMSRL